MTLNPLFMRPDQLDDNRSAWLSELPPYERQPALSGDQTADVAIVGGGITGVSAAWHLSERFPERRVVLLEAKALANGASGLLTKPIDFSLLREEIDSRVAAAN